jgi:2-succinyl-6-hydroxy-2,4-cyclohexadiene-1-carboxylate synthase
VGRVVIWALHGFLGDGEDWAFLRAPMREIGLTVLSPSLFAADAAGDWAALRIDPAGESIEQWADRFVHLVQERDAAPILTGYSLGGRLVLQALVRHPDAFRLSIIVSAGLGIEGTSQREKRRAADQDWALRFERDRWSEVLSDWNDQPLLRHSAAIERVESAFDRRRLAAALRAWSPAVQTPLASHLPHLETSVLWVAGQRDETYAEIALRAARSMPDASSWICPDSGHRVLAEQPVLLGERLVEFLKETVLE